MTNRRGVLLQSACAGAIFAAFIMAHGVPALRHDWSWIPNLFSFRAGLIDSASGWTAYGIGAAQAYPTNYIVDIVWYLFAFVIPPAAILAMTCFAIGAYASAASAALLSVGGSVSPTMRWAVAGIALFNPWTYTEVVAGHLLMILALSGLMFLVAALARSDWNDRTAFVYFLPVFPQIQFFLIAVAIALVPLFRRRAYRTLLMLLVLFAPVIVGIAAETRSLTSTPYFIQWQRLQSVRFLDAARLSGYFSGYSSVLGVLGSLSATLIALFAAASVFFGWRSRRWQIALFVALATIVIVGGLKGPLAGIYAVIVTHVPASGVYRELYDLVGIIVGAYIVMIGAFRDDRRAAAVASLISVLMISSWIWKPPTMFWAPAGAITRPVIDAQPQTRYALLPAFQPFSDERLGGSGADPDEWLRPRGITPVNSYIPDYPLGMALAKAESFGDDRDLAALGVSFIACRSWLRENGDALEAHDLPSPVVRTCRNVRIGAAPRVGLSTLPGLETAAPSLGSGNVWALDAPDDLFARVQPWKRGVVLPHASQRSFDASTAWIDAQLVERQRPYLASPFGGVFTRSREMFSVPSHSWLFAAGTFVDARGQYVGGRPGSPAWLFDGANAALRCADECEIVMISPMPPPRATALPHLWQGVSVRVPLPWLVRIDLPAGPREQLMFNERYDPAWSIWPTVFSAHHYRLDGSINAWLLPERDTPHALWLVERTALLQAVLECIALVLLVGLSLREFAFPIIVGALRRSKRPGQDEAYQVFKV